jgi:hypothetical protein
MRRTCAICGRVQAREESVGWALFTRVAPASDTRLLSGGLTKKAVGARISRSILLAQEIHESIMVSSTWPLAVRGAGGQGGRCRRSSRRHLNGGLGLNRRGEIC